MMPETWALTSATRVDTKRPGRSRVRGTVAVAATTVETSMGDISAAGAAGLLASGLQPVRVIAMRKGKTSRTMTGRR